MRTIKNSSWTGLLVLAMFCAAANAAEFAADWGPAIGGKVALQAYDQDGELRTLENLAGERGLLLFMNRSADW